MITPHTLPRRLLSTLLILFSILLGACAVAAQAPMERPAAVERESMAMPAAPQAKEIASSTGAALAFPENTATDIVTGERVVLKNASVSLIVKDPAASMSTIGRMAESMGGFIVSANMYQETLSNGAKAPHANISIRIPAERLDEALTRIKAESQLTPVSENISSDDVTQQFTDLQSRLRNLEAAEKELQRIMENAVDTEDVLRVYNQLVATREQIEVIQGQLNYFRESARLSLVSVELVADAAVQPITIGGWEPVGVAKDAIQALLDTLQFLVEAAIWLVIYILPVLLVIYLIFFLPLRYLWRWLRRGRTSKKAAPPANPE